MELIEDTEPLPDLAPVAEPSDPDDDNTYVSDLDYIHDIDELVHDHSMPDVSYPSADVLLHEDDGPSTSADVTHFRAGPPIPSHHV